MSDDWRAYLPSGSVPPEGAPEPWAPGMPPTPQPFGDSPDSSRHSGQPTPQQHPQPGQPGSYGWNGQSQAPQPYPPHHSGQTYSGGPPAPQAHPQGYPGQQQPYGQPTAPQQWPQTAVPQQPGPRQPESGPTVPRQSESTDAVAAASASASASAGDAEPDAEHPPIRPAGAQAGPGRVAMRKAARGRKRKPLKIVAWSALGVVLVGGGCVGYEYEALNSKLHGSSLHAQGDDPANAPTEIVDSFGRSPINILVIGSDSRIT